MVSKPPSALFAWPPQAAVARAVAKTKIYAHCQEQFLRMHLAVRARPGETLRDQLDRLSALSANQAAAAKLELRLRQEKQFNRKIEINAQLRTMRLEVQNLSV